MADNYRRLFDGQEIRQEGGKLVNTSQDRADSRSEKGSRSQFTKGPCLESGAVGSTTMPNMGLKQPTHKEKEAEWYGSFICPEDPFAWNWELDGDPLTGPWGLNAKGGKLTRPVPREERRTGGPVYPENHKPRCKCAACTSVRKKIKAKAVTTCAPYTRPARRDHDPVIPPPKRSMSTDHQTDEDRAKLLALMEGATPAPAPPKRRTVSQAHVVGLVGEDMVTAIRGRLRDGSRGPVTRDEGGNQIHCARRGNRFSWSIES
jgi:hypothetical protein